MSCAIWEEGGASEVQAACAEADEADVTDGAAEALSGDPDVLG